MIRMLSKEDLKGTCYFEVIAGQYKGKSWDEKSIYFDEESFLFLESIIYKLIPKYHHYGNTTMTKKDLPDFLKRLEVLVTNVKSAKDFADIINDPAIVTEHVEKDFKRDFEGSCNELLKMLEDFKEWLLQSMASFGEITISGI